MDTKHNHCFDINWLVFVLVVIFGMATWIDTYGIWVELPILVQNLPEGWDLPSYMVIIAQTANIAPLTYTIASACFPRRRLDIPVSYTIIAVGAIACLLLAFIWHVTSDVAGTRRSTALLGIQFVLALVDCTSSLACLPFMHTFKLQYLTAYFVGEGCSGLIPGLAALIQGAGAMTCQKVAYDEEIRNHTSFNKSTITLSKLPLSLYGNSTTGFPLNFSEPHERFHVIPVYLEPKFSVRSFFIFLTFCMTMSLVSFALLNHWSYCAREKIDTTSDSKGKLSVAIATSNDVKEGKTENNDNLVDSLEPDQSAESSSEKVALSDTVQPEKASVSKDISDVATEEAEAIKGNNMPTTIFALYLFLIAWLCVNMYGFLPSIQSYSCLPYGIDAFHLTVTLTSISVPAASFATFLVPVKSVRMTVVLFLLSAFLGVYITFIAASSPEPPLVGNKAGTAIVVTAWVLFTLVANFTRVSIAKQLHHQGKRALMFVGAATQVGALIGAVVSFLLVNTYGLFQDANPCRHVHI